MKSDQLVARAWTAGVAVAFGLLTSSLWAQSAGSSDAKNKSWTATRQQQLSSGTVNPTRSKITHSEEGNRTVEKQSVERVGMDGRYEPYLDTERETVKVDATTERTIERTYGRDSDGHKKLIQITEEETRTLRDGETKVIRTTSNADVNGSLQAVQREVRETRQASPTVQETKTTVFSLDPSGGLTPSVRIQERATRIDDHTVQVRKSTMQPDGGGTWQVSEVKEGVIKDDGKNRSREETVSQPGTDGRLAVIGRTVSKESASPSGEMRQTTETYSQSLPGAAPDGNLHLTQRITTRRASKGGSQSTETQVEQPDPGTPREGLRVTVKGLEVARGGADGTTQTTQTIQTLQPNGSLGVVWLNTGTSNKPSEKTPSVTVDTAQPAKPEPPAKQQ